MARVCPVDLSTLAAVVGVIEDELISADAKRAQAVVEFLGEPAQKMVVAGADVRPLYPWFHLLWATTTGNFPSVENLIEEQVVDVNLVGISGTTALWLAVEAGFPAISLLLANNSGRAKIDQVSKDGRTPLTLAVNDENIEIVRMLLEHGARPSTVNGTKVAPFWTAVETGNHEIIQLLIDARADVDDAEDWETPLNLAARLGDYELAVMLLKADASVDALDVIPLVEAMRHGHSELVSLLLRSGANPDRHDLYGETALMIAVQRGALSLAEELLTAGADPALRDNAGRTALDFARESENAEFIRLLGSAGATE